MTSSAERAPFGVVVSLTVRHPFVDEEGTALEQHVAVLSTLIHSLILMIHHHSSFFIECQLEPGGWRGKKKIQHKLSSVAIGRLSWMTNNQGNVPSVSWSKRKHDFEIFTATRRKGDSQGRDIQTRKNTPMTRTAPLVFHLILFFCQLPSSNSSLFHASRRA